MVFKVFLWSSASYLLSVALVSSISSECNARAGGGSGLEAFSTLAFNWSFVTSSPKPSQSADVLSLDPNQCFTRAVSIEEHFDATVDNRFHIRVWLYYRVFSKRST